MSVEVIDEAAELAGAPSDAAGLTEFAEQAATAILECLKRDSNELCVLLVSDQRIGELNRDWRGKDRPTDVLSFSQQEGEAMAGDNLLLGDVVISVDTLKVQASDGGWSVEEELVRLLLHGVLHLLGYDHEDADDALVMRGEERRLVHLLGERGIECAWEDDQ